MRLMPPPTIPMRGFGLNTPDSNVFIGLGAATAAPVVTCPPSGLVAVPDCVSALTLATLSAAAAPPEDACPSALAAINAAAPNCGHSMLEE